MYTCHIPSIGLSSGVFALLPTKHTLYHLPAGEQWRQWSGCYWCLLHGEKGHRYYSLLFLFTPKNTSTKKKRNDIKQQNRQTLGPSGVGRNNTVVWSSWRGYDRLVISLIYSSSTMREQYYLFGVQFLGHLMNASSILLSFSPEFDVYGGWIFTGLPFSVPIFG